MRAAAQPGDPDFVLNPQSPEFDRDPYRLLARMREQAPVYWWEPVGAWVLTRHEDVVAVMSDEERFSPDLRNWAGYPEPPAEHRDHPVMKMRESHLLS